MAQNKTKYLVSDMKHLSENYSITVEWKKKKLLMVIILHGQFEVVLLSNG